MEKAFGDLLPQMKWVNFGGGHHITRPGYDLSTLERCITETQRKYGLQVYLCLLYTSEQALRGAEGIGGVHDDKVVFLLTAADVFEGEIGRAQV